MLGKREIFQEKMLQSLPDWNQLLSNVQEAIALNRELTQKVFY